MPEVDGALKKLDKTDRLIHIARALHGQLQNPNLLARLVIRGKFVRFVETHGSASGRRVFGRLDFALSQRLFAHLRRGAGLQPSCAGPAAEGTQTADYLA